MAKSSLLVVYMLTSKKVFDTVNYEFLPNKLYHYGIRGTELQWFKTYLRGRQQCTTVNSFSSKNAYINYRVLQGSVLDPYTLLKKKVNRGIDLLSSSTFCFSTSNKNDTLLSI